MNDFDPNNVIVDEKSYSNTFIYYIAYVTIKNSKHVKINSVNPLYLMLSNMNEYFEEINGNVYLTLFPTIENKVKIKKYA